MMRQPLGNLLRVMILFFLFISADRQYIAIYYYVEDVLDDIVFGGQIKNRLRILQEICISRDFSCPTFDDVLPVLSEDRFYDAIMEKRNFFF